MRKTRHPASSSGIGPRRFAEATLCTAVLLLTPLALGQSGNLERESESSPTAAVTVDGTTLFRVRGIEAYPAEQRARVIRERIEQVAADPSVSANSLQIGEREEYTTISVGDKVLMAVTEADATLEGVDRRSLMPVYRARIAEAIDKYRGSRTASNLFRSALYSAASILAFVIALFAGNLLYRRAARGIENSLRQKMMILDSRWLRTLHAERLWSTVGGMLRAFRAAAFVAMGFFLAEFVLSQFPWTKGSSKALLSILLSPLRTMGNAFVDFLPGLIFLLVLIAIVRYLLKLLRLIFEAIENRVISFSGFEPEWAKATYHLARVLIIAFAAIVAYPYLPGSRSDAFKGISLFLGLIFSLSSSSAIANAIAGYTLTYRRAYRVGDRVKIGEAYGDVTEFRMQATYIRSLKNEEIVIPNSEILKSHVINYSTMAKQHGLILHTDVGIGYDTPWRQVEAMLLEAAQRTHGLLREPSPFVRQKSLGDFAITYEINAYCDQPQASSALYSALHRNILDIFNEYGVQIMTPAYVADPAGPKVVAREQQFGHAVGSDGLGGT